MHAKQKDSCYIDLVKVRMQSIVDLVKNNTNNNNKTPTNTTTKYTADLHATLWSINYLPILLAETRSVMVTNSVL